MLSKFQLYYFAIIVQVYLVTKNHLLVRGLLDMFFKYFSEKTNQNIGFVYKSLLFPLLWQICNGLEKFR